MLAGLKRKLEQVEAKDSKSFKSREEVYAGEQLVASSSTSLELIPPFRKYIPQSVWNSLHAHQHDAIKFLFDRLTAPEKTGVILADDMGTGKTCIGIMTSWIMARHYQCKGLILCPAGLVNNWVTELNRWLPESLGRISIVLNAVNGSKSTKALDLSVNRFITSHPVEHPVLIMSYDMFRIYAPALNTISSLEFVICDEGHRIKGLDSKISQSLNNCSAMRRVVMTGTPVQNNLQELFALVNFVIPGYLGDDLNCFKAQYENSDDSASSLELQSKLQVIMLRRTKEKILSQILPPRHMRYVFVDFSYGKNLENLITEQEKAYGDCYEEAHQCELGSSLGSTRCESNEKSSLLPVFMKARMICSGGVQLSGSMASGNIIEQAESALRQSVKLRTLQELIQVLRERNPLDKIIIASSFLSTLDTVKIVLMNHKWSSLRIDGSVSTDARHKILKLFNSTTPTSNNEPLFPILLLATKAGGEGLNLVAANHLIMMDIDWNPAVDAQTMGRIWRPGQQKEVYIYRILIPNSIEETILQRQTQKSALKSLLDQIDQSDSNIGKNDFEVHEDSFSLLPIKSESMAKILRPRAETRTFNDILSCLQWSEGGNNERCAYETRIFFLSNSNISQSNIEHTICFNISESSLF